jgi:hypothetical protein
MHNPDFVKLSESMGAKALRCTNIKELPAMMKEFLEYDGTRPIVMECLVSSEHVYPMVPAGKALHEQIVSVACVQVHVIPVIVADRLSSTPRSAARPLRWGWVRRFDGTRWTRWDQTPRRAEGTDAYPKSMTHSASRIHHLSRVTWGRYLPTYLPWVFYLGCNA